MARRITRSICSSPGGRACVFWSAYDLVVEPGLLTQHVVKRDTFEEKGRGDNPGSGATGSEADQTSPGILGVLRGMQALPNALIATAKVEVDQWFQILTSNLVVPQEKREMRWNTANLWIMQISGSRLLLRTTSQETRAYDRLREGPRDTARADIPLCRGM